MSSRVGKPLSAAADEDGRGRPAPAVVEGDVAGREDLSLAAAGYLRFFKGLLAC